MRETLEWIDPNYEEKWFDPAELLPLIEAILVTIEENSLALPTPTGFENWERCAWIEFLSEDLQILRDQMRGAVACGAKFNLQFCY